MRVRACAGFVLACFFAFSCVCVCEFLFKYVLVCARMRLCVHACVRVRACAGLCVSTSLLVCVIALSAIFSVRVSYQVYIP